MRVARFARARLLRHALPIFVLILRKKPTVLQSKLYLPDEECASHTKRVGDNKTVQFTTQEVRRSASHWLILLPDPEKPIEDSLKGVSRNLAT